MKPNFILYIMVLLFFCIYGKWLAKNYAAKESGHFYGEHEMKGNWSIGKHIEGNLYICEKFVVILEA